MPLCVCLGAHPRLFSKSTYRSASVFRLRETNTETTRFGPEAERPKRPWACPLFRRFSQAWNHYCGQHRIKYRQQEMLAHRTMALERRRAQTKCNRREGFATSSAPVVLVRWRLQEQRFVKHKRKAARHNPERPPFEEAARAFPGQDQEQGKHGSDSWGACGGPTKVDITADRGSCHRRVPQWHFRTAARPLARTRPCGSTSTWVEPQLCVATRLEKATFAPELGWRWARAEVISELGLSARTSKRCMHGVTEATRMLFNTT